ncbi:MAG: proton-conducting transporter membrane subunit, partial [Candidatus Eisenbacteria bacterium]|nr:proton-conducting transporter membrane subunit [Candidatus Eisenbacteria bacterium]
IVGFGFKLAFVPFHMWSPDVYQGAPPPATALIASGSKGAIFALLFRLASDLDLASDPPARLLLTALCVATMFGGNLLALRQRNLRRLLAYSSIAHMGYLTIPLLAGGEVGFGAFGFYLVSYFATILAAFGVIAVLSTPGREVQEIEDLRGLGRERPLAGFVLALAMVSLVGIPLTAGFVAKFYIFGAGVRAGLWTLVLLAVVASGISAYYYVRVLVTLYATREAGAAAPAALAQRPSSPWAWAAILALALVVLFFGIYPAPLIALASGAMGMGAPMAGW